ncbi:MAG: YicC/YloC family endoribonuclease [Bacillota bacterium]
MIYSMTGFGRSIVSRDGRELQVELKSVNHRYLDISVRMPKALGALEDMVRKLLAAKLARGHIDVFISYRNTAQSSRKVHVDLGLLGAYLDAFTSIEDRFHLQNDITLLGAGRLPDVLTVADVPEDEEVISAMLTDALEEAVGSVLRMRAAEGEHLLGDMLQRLDLIRDRLKIIEQRSPVVVLEYKEKLEERIAALMQGTVPDTNRLQTEVAVFADRSSITEEIVRLKSHLTQFARTANAGGAAGRKLDFMVQEMNREVNTIGSKANDLDITNSVLEIKGEIEKIREQVQNIE